MDFSFIFIDLGNKYKLEDLKNFFNQNYQDYQLIYCSSLLNVTKDNVNCYFFDENANPELIVNSTISKCTKNNIVIVRKIEEFEEITNATSLLTNDNQIVVLKNKKSKFRLFFHKIAKKLINKVLNRDLKNINHRLICFGKNTSSVLKELKNPSNLSRINNWQGVDYEEIETDKKYKVEYNVTKNVLLTLIPFSIAVTCILIFAFFCKEFNTFVNIVIWLVILSNLAVSSVFGLNWIYKKNVGDNIIDKMNLKDGKN